MVIALFLLVITNVQWWGYLYLDMKPGFLGSSGTDDPCVYVFLLRCWLKLM